MSLFNIMDIANSALEAQSKKIRTSAENLANIDTLTYKNKKIVPYQPKQVINTFHQSYSNIMNSNTQNPIGGVSSEIIEQSSPKKIIYNPNHPLSNKKGYLSVPNIDVVTENINIMEASRNYEANIEILNTVKAMILKTLTIGQ
ncbi:flagellar basal body rod protein FlgC [Buchnera aphidicola (Thelaxes californica)]|uniref:Flagellar basal-body rod protein FlgC n=1 Tax=Buchnera aphidicola (Thelaxes californica) TaxID=1315998 RepID=A0A4D6YFD2_9GAMM|nr:flagellar basal body rod protein FlgC [Buchnera aphidicola]QCI26793.1 flagellar basal body rod protein FlgC [Buchnera aphidicola (Thelaxes californica)]